MPEREWEVISSPQGVEARSMRRLQFEPKEDMRSFRVQLRSALREFSVNAGEHLLAEYRPALTSRPADWVDLENAALYNVGMGSFAHLMDAGITCRRLPPDGESHILSYTGSSEWRTKSPDESFAECNISVPDGRLTPADWWLLCRKELRVTSIGPLEDGARYSLDIRLRGSRTGRWLAANLKGMLDGITACLHAHDGSNEEILEPMLTAKLGRGAWELLNDDAGLTLPRRKLVRPHAAAIAWNPADELCDGFEVRIERSQTARLMAHILRNVEN